MRARWRAETAQGELGWKKSGDSDPNMGGELLKKKAQRRSRVTRLKQRSLRQAQ